MGAQVSAQKQKGTAAETSVVNYLKDNGFPHASRIGAINGYNDKGDIDGCGPIVIEVKNHKALDLAGWLKELEVEIKNAGVQTGVVIAKRRGTTDVGEWYAVMSVDILLALLKEAGF